LAHIALATKFRPRSFADVATQEHVSETLRSAVAGGRVGHAYLFCGPRGVGKTTLARVLAMALNCPDRTAEGEPCGQCESCRRIWGGHTALDVVEIDAASNRGVDDARDLRERAMYAPSGEGRHKVYIVDEAHMLTREAWNALLKILEEPPPRVIFVFATTEPQKIQQVAAPILSRCQRFDFRRIGTSDIVARLQAVLAEEGVSAPEDALRIVARKADGGMRDALSLLDQVLSLTGGTVDAESVRRVLGLVEEERYLELLDIVREGRHGDVFGLIDSLLDEGYDLVEFYHGLLDVLRTLLRLRLSPDVPLDVREDLRTSLLERAQAFEAADLVRMLGTAAELESQGSLRRSPNPRLPIEMLLLRLSFLDRTVTIEELLGALGGSPPAGGAGGGPSAGAVSGAAGGRGASRTGPGRAPTAASEPAPSSAAPPAAPAPAAEPSPASPSEVHFPDAASAWRGWLESGRGVPRGLGAFLRPASVTEDADGKIRVRGLAEPAVERLRDGAVLKAVRDGFALFLGRLADVVVDDRPGARAASSRVTEAEVREGALKALFRQEPRLRRAVEELDLELME
jgi:DNA polymerase-3 subunit gamma/tau